MNCTLTLKQQKLLLGKVAIDLKNNPSFDFKTYAKDFFNNIATKTGDKVLAANYVALLPMNIRAVMGANKMIFRKLSTAAGQISDFEARFEDYNAVEEFVDTFSTQASDLVNLQKTLQKESLVTPPQQKEIEVKQEIKPLESLSLSDIPMDDDKDNFLKPEMKVYADAKEQLIKNMKADGSSVLGGLPVRLTVMSTKDFRVGDFYPDTQRAINSGEEKAVQGSKTGVVLVVTNRDGDPIHFDDKLENRMKEDGKIIYFTIRKPVEGAPLNQADKALITSLQKSQGLSYTDAEAAVKKKLELIKKVREYVASDPAKNKVSVNLTGGTINYAAKVAKNKVTISALNMNGGQFTPYKGVEGKGQRPNVYYFDYPGSNITMPINSPSIPQDLVQKLVQLLSEDVNIKQGSKSFKFGNAEKIKLFNQFIYIDKDVFDLSIDQAGELVVKKLGVTTTYPTKADFAKDIQDILTRKVLTRKISAEEAKGKTKVVDLRGAMYNQVYQNILPNGNAEYYMVGQVQLKVNDTAFKNNVYNDFNLTPGTEGFNINVESKPYYPFIANNFLLSYEVDGAGNLQTAGSILNFELTPDSLNTLAKQNVVKEYKASEDPDVQAEVSKGEHQGMFDENGNMNPEVFKKKTDDKVSGINQDPVERPLSAREKLLKLRKDNPKKFDKLVGQKGLDATIEQIEAAQKWYSNHPMSAYFPFETLFNVVNQENSNSIATWTMSGITLYKGADYSELYHEAWHGFTQGFLGKDDKVGLYNEMRKKSGSFVDYTGKLVEFKNATDLQVEEFLAEDFREYMLSDGNKVLQDSPKRNSIFRKIWNFLKQLFGSSNINQTVTDEQITENVRQLYEKLRIGDLNSYTFAVENRNYDTLNKALQSIAKDEVEKSLSFENSNLIYSTVDSLFSEGIDVMNQANVDDINERRDLQTKQNPTAEDKKRLDELNAQITSGYTTLLLATPKGVRSLYEYTKSRIEEQLANLTEKNVTTPSTYLQKKIDLLEYTLRNFGDIETLYTNRRDEGVIGYHMYKSQLIEDDLFDELSSIQRQAEEQQDLDDLMGRESEGKDYFDRGGNERSIFDLAIREVRNIIGSLNKTDIEGVVIENQLGFPELVNYREAFAQIARLTQNSKDLVEMYDKLQKASDIYPPIKQLLNKLGPLSYEGQTDREVDLWSKFFQTFNKYRILLVQTTVNEQENFKEVEYGDEILQEKQKSTFDIKIGNALSDYKRVDQDWRDVFSKANTNTFIKNDRQGNYLNVKGILEKYPTIESVNAEPMQFLNDIGIKMKEINVIKVELDKALKSGSIRLNGIYDNLRKLDEKGITVRGLGAYLNHNPKLGIIGQTGQNSNYGKLLTIQTKYSGDYSDFMVQNAAGDPQSEFSQNNSLTQLVKQINSVKSYNELVANQATAHYNNSRNIPGRPYNPFVNSSIWINSLFNMGVNEGTKYDNEIVIENLSGINSSINDSFFEEGVAKSQVDEIGALLNDFHTQLMKFTPELTRHAGKKTALAVSLRNYKTGSRNSKLYIDSEDFVNDTGEFNRGFDNFHRIIVKYIGAELDRVNYAKYLLTPEAGVKEFDFAYLNRGTKFVAFDGVLSDETKKALYEIKGNLSEYLNTPQGSPLSERIYDEVLEYFNGLVDGVQTKMNEYNFVSPTLLEKTKADAIKIGKQNVTDQMLRRGLNSSFVANNWIHHFEEMIMLYGDIALYKDFFKRNASLNSTGDIIRNDQYFINYANQVLGKPFSKLAGANQDLLSYNGILNTAVVADVLVKSVYADEYRKAVNSPVIDSKYGDKGVNEADAQGLVAFDSYRIILKGLGKWTNEQERIYQDLLSGTPADQIGDPRNFFPTLKMGMFGPVQNEYLPLTGLHKFALFPLIPGAIPQNLQTLHEKMMKEGIDYLTFESGSKVGTVSKPAIKDGVITGNKLENLYSDLNKRELSTTPFVKNKVFAEYLKYQVEATPKFKGKMTLPTQLRKLVELGLIENGVPTDYKGGKQAWESLNETQKKAASKNYELRQRYINGLRRLVEAKKQQLLNDIGWTRNKDGSLKGDMSSLLELISNELKRSDVGEHEWAYIQTIKGQDIKNSLDISQSAEMIEKVITALVNKRLINIKVNGEQLVMVSTTGFENLAFAYSGERNFEKPSAEDLAKYGTNDLPTYHIRNGKIAAAKVKIAIQGDFKKLLQLDDVRTKAKELGISNLQALNTLLKDEAWLDQGDNRAMISMVGARIPTQGANSADFVEVYEFLPEIAGNIIIAPSEVTSKGGSDFDYDKLPLMMPNLRVVNGKVELAKNYNEEQAKEAYKLLLKENIHKLTFKGLDKREIRLLLRTSDRFEKIDQVVANLLGPDYYEELAKIVQEDTMKSFEDFYEELNGTKTIENDIMQSLREILERPDNFADLIRPNETDLVKPLADEIRGDSAADKQGNKMFEPLKNIQVQQANSVGKDTLGIGAISNTFNALFNSIGLTLPKMYLTGFRLNVPARVDILLPHNKVEGEVLLSGLKDVNETNIADVISQLINGWVDVEKDDWISYIQGNKEISPVMLFLVQAGVPIKDVVKFVTQPIIKDYVQEQRLNKGNFSKVLGKSQDRQYKRSARNTIMRRFGFDSLSVSDIAVLAEIYTEGIDDFSKIESALGESKGGKVDTQTEEKVMETFSSLKQLEEGLKRGMDLMSFEKTVSDLLLKAEDDKEAKLIHRKLTIVTHPDKGGNVKFSQALNDLYDKYKDGTLSSSGFIDVTKKKEKKSRPINYDLARFLHFLELEQYAQKTSDLQRAFNVDTTPLQNITEYYDKINEIKNLSKNSGEFIRQSFVNKVLTDSPVGPFYVHEFALDLFGRVLPLRNSKKINEFLNTLDSGQRTAVNALYDLNDKDDRIRFYQAFKNDLFSYIFQNQVRGFNSAGQNYKNNKVEFNIENVEGLKFGAFVKDGKLYVDKAQLESDYNNGAFSEQGYGNGHLALVGSKDAFVNKDEYSHFVYERETLRSLYPFNQVNGSIEFNEFMKENERKDELRKEGESTEDFIKRIEKLSYEELLRDKALYNIFSPYQLFRSKTSVATNYGFIVDKYPALKENFSILNNIKSTSKDGFTNLMPSVMKFTKDEIDTFHENLKDLSNSNKLVNLEGINQRDADYISSFFTKLPFYLYLQAGPNTRNAFSFGRIIPQDRIQRILEKPVKELTENITDDYLKEFLNRFVVANSDKRTRNRFKEFLKQEKPTSAMQTDLFTETEDKEMDFPISMSEITNHSGGAVGADSMFDTIGKEFGQTEHKHYWAINKTPLGNVELTPEQLKEGIVHAKAAAKVLGRPWVDKYAELLGRNWFQVKNSTQVIAIGPIVYPGENNSKGYKVNALRPTVDGGTGYAVEMGIANGKKVHVFDTKTNQWYKWDGNTFVKSVVPALDKNFAGIGSRQDKGVMTKESIQAIRDVYEKSANMMSQLTGVNKSEQYTKDRYDAALGTAKTFMSNFDQLKNPITDTLGNEYWNSEGYYMSLRTNDPAIKKQIAEDSKVGGQAARNARKKYTLEMDEGKRAEYMLDTVRKKFQANPELASQLIATGNQEIIEKNYWKDNLFGVVDTTLKGANVLGKSLMQVRSELQGQAVSTTPKTITDAEIDEAMNRCFVK